MFRSRKTNNKSDVAYNVTRVPPATASPKATGAAAVASAGADNSTDCQEPPSKDTTPATPVLPTASAKAGTTANPLPSPPTGGVRRAVDDPVPEDGPTHVDDRVGAGGVIIPDLDNRTDGGDTGQGSSAGQLSQRQPSSPAPSRRNQKSSAADPRESSDASTGGADVERYFNQRSSPMRKESMMRLLDTSSLSNRVSDSIPGSDSVKVWGAAVKAATHPELSKIDAVKALKDSIKVWRWRRAVKAAVHPDPSRNVKENLKDWKAHRDAFEVKLKADRIKHITELEEMAKEKCVGLLRDVDDAGPSPPSADVLTSADVLWMELGTEPCEHLVHLNLSKNNLSNMAVIIKCLEKLPKLIILKLENNRFTDVVDLGMALFGAESAKEAALDLDSEGKSADSGVKHTKLCVELEELWLAGNPIDDSCVQAVCTSKPRANCKDSLKHLIEYREEVVNIWSKFHLKEKQELDNTRVIENLFKLQEIAEREGKDALEAPAMCFLMVNFGSKKAKDESEDPQLNLAANEKFYAKIATRVKKMLSDLKPVPDSVDITAATPNPPPRATETRLEYIKLFLRLYVQTPLMFCSIQRKDEDDVNCAIENMYNALCKPCIDVIREDMQATFARLKDTPRYQDQIRAWARGFRDDFQTYAAQMNKCWREDDQGGGVKATNFAKAKFWTLIGPAFPGQYKKVDASSYREKNDGVFEPNDFDTIVQPTDHPLKLLIAARKDMAFFNTTAIALVQKVNAITTNMGGEDVAAVLQLRPLFKRLKHGGGGKGKGKGVAASSHAAAHISGTKGVFRMIEKSLVKKKFTLNNDGGEVRDYRMQADKEWPDCKEIRDVYGCLIECSSFHAMGNVFKCINESDDWEVLRVKNRLYKTESGKPTTGNWQDVMINVREKRVVGGGGGGGGVGGGDDDRPRCIFEIQVANTLMLNARKACKGHNAFVAFRGFDELLQYNGFAKLVVEVNSGTKPRTVTTKAQEIEHIEQKISELQEKLLELKAGGSLTPL